MLYEIKNIKRYTSEPKRRWFFDHFFDLTVWLDDHDAIIGFQLCYNKPKDPHALTWDMETGYHHNRIDDGEGTYFAGTKGIPILLKDGPFSPESIADTFEHESRTIDPRISDFINQKLMQLVAESKKS